MSVYILAIESSCDDTSIAIMKDAKLLSMGVSGQKIHENYGGVVPELASRAHLQHMVPLVDTVLKDAQVDKNKISAVAFTQGPGLLGSLLVGTSFAKGFALSADVPLVAVNHMKAHVLAHLIEDPKPEFPYLCLTVSGGHTQIVLVESPYDFKILGETLDDAAGEAFDKTGKMLGLPYPAGPIIDKLAKEGLPRYQFTKPSLEGYNFSFSGLKTGIRNFLRKESSKNPDFIESHINDICQSVQKTIVDILIETLERASKDFGIPRVAIAGGVSANSQLRTEFQEMANRNNWEAFIPKFAYCTDNAAMIAISGHYEFLQSNFVGQDIIPNPRLKV